MNNCALCNKKYKYDKNLVDPEICDECSINKYNDYGTTEYKELIMTFDDKTLRDNV